MAEESPISAEDGWYTGEDKVLRFTVYGQDRATVENVTGWTFEFAFHRRREAAPVFVKTSAAGVTVLDGPAGLVGVQINADDTRELGPPESYNYVLRRTDPGSEQVLAHGGAVLRSAVTA